MANTFNLGNGSWAQKTEKLLAYNAENDNYKPLPFDFDRASTATRVNKQGLIETVGVDEPRIDFLNNTKGHLLLEPSRQNVITYSEDFTQNSWLKLSTGTAVIPVITANQGISPDGTQNAAKVFFDRGSGVTQFDYSRLYFAAGSAPSSASIYVKSFDGVSNYQMALKCGNTQKTISVTTEWKRFTVTELGGGSNIQLILQGNIGASQTASVLIYGAQLEQGSYATSYIPTQGSAVTRSAESCNQTVPSGIIGQTEGTLYTEINITKLLGTTSRSIVRLGSAVDLVDFSFLGGLNNSIRAVIRTSANTRFQAVFEIQSVGVYKLAIGYKSNDSVFYVNGVQINNTINTSFTMPSIEDITYNYSTELNDSVNQTKLYNTRLSNSELATLTTL